MDDPLRICCSHACRRLGVRPEETVTFTHNPAGVAAGLAGGLAVIGVGEGAHGEALLGFGAERVVPSVSTLLDRVLPLPPSPGYRLVDVVARVQEI